MAQGIKIVRKGRSVDAATTPDIIVSSELETLPIFDEADFRLRVVTAALAFGYSETQIVHNLGFSPDYDAWIDFANGDRAKLPAVETVGSLIWIYDSVPDETSIFIYAFSLAFDPSAEPPFTRTGFAYVYDKEVALV